MEPARNARTVGTMAALFGAAAIFLESPAFCLAAISLLVFLIALAFRFRYRMHRIVASAAVERSANKKTLPQGGTVVILMTFTCRPEQGTSVAVREIPAPGTGSDAPAHVVPVGPDGSATLLYNLTPLVPGKTAAPGIVVTVTDPFFTADLGMTSPPFRGPELEVHPHAAYERARTRSDTAAREKNRASVERGSNIRSFREFLPGDDIRSVDWKMTAKYQRLFIREFMSVENVPPLVVLDVPGSEVAVPDAQLALLINSANKATATAIKAHGSVSLFIISGINVLSILLQERNPQRCTAAILDAAQPQARLYHAYRLKNREALRSVVRTCGRAVLREIGAERRFHSRIAAVCRKSLASPDVPVFVTQVGKLLRSVQLKEIHLFSLFAGDTSHLQEIAFQAQEQSIRVLPRAPEGIRVSLPGADPAGVMA